jgi:hypothetical protein
MKNLLILFVLLFSLSGKAHEIEGTLVLKGAIKTKIYVNMVKTTCRVKVDKVKNLLLEDSYGNPAYRVLVDLSLNGSDLERDRFIKYKRSVWLNNLFPISSKNSEVRDLEYVSAENDVKMLIDRKGRIKQINYKALEQNITCNF